MCFSLENYIIDLCIIFAFNNNSNNNNENVFIQLL